MVLSNFISSSQIAAMLQMQLQYHRFLHLDLQEVYIHSICLSETA